ncbi:MAG: energy transducer TonB [Nitrospinaceae bacterium]
MRIEFLRSLDFNQMLVASVFAHFLFMTVVLFLPNPVTREKVIRPAFMVKLVEISSHKKSVPQKKHRKNTLSRRTKSVLKREAKPRPRVPKPPPKPRPIQPVPNPALIKISPEKVAAKPMPNPAIVKIPPKPVAVKPEPVPPPPVAPPEPVPVKPKAIKVPKDTTKEIVKDLDRLDGKTPPGLVDELDELTKLKPKIPQKNSVVTSKTISDETFKELESLKQKKVIPQKKHISPKVVNDPLKQFDQLKMKKEVDAANIAQNPNKAEKKLSALEELEIASLPRQTVEIKKRKNEKSASDLLKELAQMEDVRSAVAAPVPETTASLSSQESAKEFEPILKKLDSLGVSSQPITIDVVNSKTLSLDFRSDVWKVQVPEKERIQFSTKSQFANTESRGEPSEDILSRYIGIVREKVYKKWYEPLAERHDKEVVVSFFIFPKGNINKPSLIKSSGVEQLDSLALRAVLESVPFPNFPKELKFSNLNISIHFKYVPEEN